MYRALGLMMVRTKYTGPVTPDEKARSICDQLIADGQLVKDGSVVAKGSEAYNQCVARARKDLEGGASFDEARANAVERAMKGDSALYIALGVGGAVLLVGGALFLTRK
jgi:hypothetical protein